MFGIHIGRKWKSPKALIALMAVEFLGTVAVLALFGLAEPDLFRTKLWQVGYDNGFNSSPKQILYAYANYEPIPKTPFVWSHTLTAFNVAIAVLGTFILLVKAVMFALHIWYPFLAVVTNIALTALWCVSIYGQAGPDKSDPRHPSTSAWYVTKSCSYAKASGNEQHCMMAKGTFAASVLMMAIFLANLVLAIYSLIPSSAQRAANKIAIDDMQSKGGNNGNDSPISESSEHQRWEMTKVPKATATPYTPRTLAFNTLDRQLPLRSQQEGPLHPVAARFA